MPWLIAFISAFLFGIATPFSKALLNEVHPFLLAALFYLGAALILLPKTVNLHVRSPIPKLTASDLWNLLGSLFFGGMVGPVLLLFGLRMTPATNASLLLNLETPATAMLAYLFFKENIGRRTAISNLGIVLAGVLLTFEGTSVPGWGGVFIALACIAWGLDNNHTASIHNIDPVRCTFLKGITFGTVNLLIAWRIIPVWPSWERCGFALIIGAFSYGISIVLYIYSARELGAARSQMIFTSAPFFGVIVSQLYLAEPFFIYQLIAALLMIGMFVILFKEKHSHIHRHAVLEHVHRHSHTDEHHQHLHEKRDEADGTHSHIHTHDPIIHGHSHHPDLHHRHEKD
ncbi:MAG: EamA family transporter [Deltaproteobacteria bacterium]|nr:EamA family transporter [Deltaproteobacteria bacterium]